MAGTSLVRRCITVAVFVDTNVLLYAVDRADAAKHRAATDWRTELWKSRAGRISFQVLQEFYVNVRSKWPSAVAAARVEIRDLLAWRPVAISGALFELGWKIQDRYSLSFWDAMIVAAAKESSCQYLLTEDLQSGQDLDGIIVLDPFTNDPDSILR
jgi:predicted nucleic acid-binding protein